MLLLRRSPKLLGLTLQCLWLDNPAVGTFQGPGSSSSLKIFQLWVEVWNLRSSLVLEMERLNAYVNNVQNMYYKYKIQVNILYKYKNRTDPQSAATRSQPVISKSALSEDRVLL